jgi:hypothetical protein
MRYNVLFIPQTLGLNMRTTILINYNRHFHKESLQINGRLFHFVLVDIKSTKYEHKLSERIVSTDGAVKEIYDFNITEEERELLCSFVEEIILKYEF